VLTAGADDACPPCHTNAMFDALASPDKQKVQVEGANHYFSGASDRPHLVEAAEAITGWLAERGLNP